MLKPLYRSNGTPLPGPRPDPLLIDPPASIRARCQCNSGGCLATARNCRCARCEDKDDCATAFACWDNTPAVSAPQHWDGNDLE